MQNSLCHNTQEFPDELPPETLLLHGQYQIESYLIRGGFAITYLARDSLDRRVVIKECFPNMVSCRIDGLVQARKRDQKDQFSSLLRHFLREARRLAHLSHPNIVKVHQVFEENGTAYMALDHVEGMDLLSVVEDHPQRLKPDMVRSMLIKSLGAVNYIHGKGILHRDISPDNILLDGHDNLTLIDFGAAREHVTRENRALSSLLSVKDGYSPQEFYLKDVVQGPSSDLYALGATFYHLITGQAPPDSQQRLASVAAGADDPIVRLVANRADYEPDFLDAINKALEIFPEDRLQSAMDWVEAIDPERRKQAALARAGKDKSIRQKISKLVADTNQSLRSQGKPTARIVAKSVDRAGDTDDGTDPGDQSSVAANQPMSTPVDIFGDPIEDVEAWLWAQDRLAQRRPDQRVNKPSHKPKPVLRKLPDIHNKPTQTQPTPPESAPKPEPRRRTQLRTLVWRLATVGFHSSKSP